MGRYRRAKSSLFNLEIRYEIKIADITKELNESFGKCLDVIVKQFNEFSYSDI